MSSITGKDRKCPETITIIRNLLNDFGFVAFDIKTGKTGTSLFSIHLYHKVSGLFSNGKGSSKDAALASAWAEFFERLMSGFFFTDYIPFLESEAAEDSVSYCNEFTNSEIQFNQTIINQSCVSNGLAAGNTILEAKIQALSEVMERYVRGCVLENRYVLPELANDTWTGINAVHDLSIEAEKNNCAIRVMDASLGGAFPVVCILLLHNPSGRVLWSFGAHPNMNIALERTATEIVQGRDLSDFSEFVFPTDDADLVADSVNFESHFIDSTGDIHDALLFAEPDFAACTWGCKNSREAEWEFLLDRAKSAGMPVYSFTYYEKEVAVVRIYSPGYSEIYTEPEPDELPLLATFMKDPQACKQEDVAALIDFLEHRAYSWHIPVPELFGLSETRAGNWDQCTLGLLYAFLLLLAGRIDEGTNLLHSHISQLEAGPLQKTAYLLAATGLDTHDLFRNRHITDWLGAESKSAAHKLLQGEWPAKLLPPGGEAFKNFPGAAGIRKAYNLFRKIFS